MPIINCNNWWKALKELLHLKPSVTSTTFNIQSLGNLVRTKVLSLSLRNLPTVKFVYFSTNSIAINFARENSTMPMVYKALKRAMKGEISITIAILALFRQKDAVKSKPEPPMEKYCSRCESLTHPISKC